MTAIINYLNPRYVALAVDSTITITDNGITRFENDFNKLFQIHGKRIVIIQYNNPWFCGVSIKEIVNDFNKYCLFKSLPTVEECYQLFKNFIVENGETKFQEVHNEQAMGLIFVGLGDEQEFISLFSADFKSLERGILVQDLTSSIILNRDDEPFFFVTGDTINYALNVINGTAKIESPLKEKLLNLIDNPQNIESLILENGNIDTKKLSGFIIDTQAYFCEFLINLIVINRQLDGLKPTVGGDIKVAYINSENGFKQIK